jgi:hypothetical protein
MNEEFVLKINFNRIVADAWIEKRIRPDGSYDLIGMGRLTEYDRKTGELVSDKTEPTGLTGWSPK